MNKTLWRDIGNLKVQKPYDSILIVTLLSLSVTACTGGQNSPSYSLHKCCTYTHESAQGHKLTQHWLTHTIMKDSVSDF